MTGVIICVISLFFGNCHAMEKIWHHWNPEEESKSNQRMDQNIFKSFVDMQGKLNDEDESERVELLQRLSGRLQRAKSKVLNPVASAAQIMLLKSITGVLVITISQISSPVQDIVPLEDAVRSPVKFSAEKSDQSIPTQKKKYHDCSQKVMCKHEKRYSKKKSHHIQQPQKRR